MNDSTNNAAPKPGPAATPTKMSSIEKVESAFKSGVHEFEAKLQTWEHEAAAEIKELAAKLHSKIEALLQRHKAANSATAAMTATQNGTLESAKAHVEEATLNVGQHFASKQVVTE